ncbi:flavocytochrome c [Shewanella sp. D64]|uniref:flavocytochrome c n=1 Tax=unclassified Shewanella TaxID=196818 RepID=UPI0022BA3637|nr:MULTISPECIES: flavocytochrome c [unclassified Shewanella]MEC4727413.1 flavocytochrome c [Shewanella sp. D64]MEC4739568.1 flavocytochrome c [Shewanella sp. E94]WBJ96049.1 flavocytochrome c [Shewanella sp. MTB7]
MQTRRSFLKFGVGAAAIGALAPLSVSANSSDVIWDEEHEVVIVGSGFAGLAAAVEAGKLGAKDIVVFEKLGVYGGNSTLNAGQACFADTDLQRKLGIKDSVDLMVQDQLASGRGYASEILLRHSAELGPYVYQLTKDCGCVYRDHIINTGGTSVTRSHQVVERSGAGFIRPMLKTARSYGVKTKTRHKFEGLITTEDGTVLGIKVRKNYQTDHEDSGTLINVRAEKGVLIATGGFAANVAFRQALDPTLGDEVGHTNARGATGDGLIAMLAEGAMPIHLSFIQSGPWASPDEGGFGYGAGFSLYNFPHSIAIDRNTGERFMNETADRKHRADLEIQRRDKDGKPHPALLIAPKHEAQKDPSMDNVLRYNVAWEFDSIEAIAKHFELPLKPFQKQVDDWNKYVKAGEDPQFGKRMNMGTGIYMTAPFIVQRLWPKVHYCQGGIQINTKAEVIAAKNGKPIPNLYAAGEVSGGVHGVSRLGGCSTPDCMAFGVTAARSMMKA